MLVHRYRGPFKPGRLATVSGPGSRGGAGATNKRQRCMTVMVQEFCELGTLKDVLSKKKAGFDKCVRARARICTCAHKHMCISVWLCMKFGREPIV